MSTMTSPRTMSSDTMRPARVGASEEGVYGTELAVATLVIGSPGASHGDGGKRRALGQDPRVTNRWPGVARAKRRSHVRRNEVRDPPERWPARLSKSGRLVRYMGVTRQPGTESHA